MNIWYMWNASKTNDHYFLFNFTAYYIDRMWNIFIENPCNGNLIATAVLHVQEVRCDEYVFQ